MPKGSKHILDTSIEYLKGVGPKRAELLQKELQIHTFRDLLLAFPFRYVDKTRFHKAGQIGPQDDQVQIRGVLRRLEVLGQGRKKRLVGRLRDETGAIDLVWFKGVNWMKESLVVGKEYVVFGRINQYKGKISLPHPEIEDLSEHNAQTAATLAPVYPSTEKLNTRGLDAKARRRLMRQLFQKLAARDLPENLPAYFLQKLQLLPRPAALRAIHFPKNEEERQAAEKRLKFEELFFHQLRMLRIRRHRKDTVKGFVFSRVGEFFHKFYDEKLPFTLTGAQKRVIKEVRQDLKSGQQMNRLLQGDVGSGKTIVALMCALIAMDNGFQVALMAPTEILAQQHFQSISQYLEGIEVEVDFLSGSVKGKTRKTILQRLAEGQIHLLVGTHALLEEPVVFQNLGLAITDEQHRFGVKQRARLWKKSRPHPPHVLVMTATPIPRTLAMTLYGDLDVSVIDELPPGRKPVNTVHKYEKNRLRVFGFMREEIAKGRQVYVVFPLIEESETLDLKNLQEGYEALAREFPTPEFQISVVHGRMKPADKDFEMQRFVQGKTHIMVATTVIEVGVNVPNASVMVIEDAQRFGLSQLHQLRGRVGRGAEQSHCILMTGYKLSNEARERIQTMCRTNDGFEIAEADLQLRGPGDIEGTQQSGMVSLRIANLAKDGRILQTARAIAARVLDQDPELAHPKHLPLRQYLARKDRQAEQWSRIS